MIICIADMQSGGTSIQQEAESKPAEMLTVAERLYNLLGVAGVNTVQKLSQTLVQQQYQHLTTSVPKGFLSKR